LRDKTEAAVTAEVSRGYESTARRFTNDAASCVYVLALADRQIGLSYRLATGELDEVCGGVQVAATWRDSIYAVFADASCSGPAYAVGAQLVLKIGQDFFYTDGPPPMASATYYRWTASSSTCTPITPAAAQPLWLTRWFRKT
jgi:hypothetical protein